MTNDTDEKKQSFNFTTAHRVSHADLLVPTTYVKGKPKIVGPSENARYGGTFIVAPDDEDLKKLKAEVVALLNANNPTNAKLIVSSDTKNVAKFAEEIEAGTARVVNVPWKSGDKEADRAKAKNKDAEYARGFILVKGSSKYQPQLAAVEKGNVLEFDLVTHPEQLANAKKYFYSGAFLVPSFGLNYYKGDEGKPDGVNLFLNAVLFAKHGPRLGGRAAPASETFKGYIGSIKDEDPTGGEAEDLDDEIPF